MERNDNIFDRGGRNDLHWTAMLYHNGRFYMFYNYGMAVHGPTPYMVGLARSDDGEKFETVKDVAISPGMSWDGQLIEAHNIIRAGGVWRMYYCGSNVNWRIGFAESENLWDWKRHPEPILDLGDASWENTHVADPHVVFFKGKYLMYYVGKGEVWQLGLAESRDGIEWDKCLENPIVRANEEWCNGCVVLSGVINYRGQLLGTFHGYDTEKKVFTTRLFKSLKGIDWTPLDIPPIEPGKWSNRGIVHPEPMLIDDKLMVYFTGIKLGEPNQHRIGRVIYDEEEIPL